MGDHTETLLVEFDSALTDYETLLKIFWGNHNSTTPLKRQYMSAIFYFDDQQKTSAHQTKEEAQRKIGSRKILTQILPAETFYDAEGYHQKYLLRQHPSLLDSLQLSDEQLVSSHTATRLTGYVGGYGSPCTFLEESKNLGLSDSQIDYVTTVMADSSGGAYCSL